MGVVTVRFGRYTQKRTKQSIVFYGNKLVYVRPSRVEGIVGERWISIKALPLHRTRLIRPKRWRVGSDSRSEPERRRGGLKEVSLRTNILLGQAGEFAVRTSE